MSNRRKFLQHLGILGISPALLEKRLFRYSAPESLDSPLLFTSRGEDWGRKILEPAWAKLHETGSILDAVETGANVCELDPADESVGYGGLPDERGIVTLDASVMYGPTHKVGSVAGMENIKKASSVARLVMERTDHALLVGRGAFEFARAHGFPEENLLTESARLKWLQWKENLSKDDDWGAPDLPEPVKTNRKGGTINVLGMSASGDVAGITSTSGLFAKIHGRVGDSPIIGAGLYLDNEVGAAGATGRGEELLRTCGSFLLVEKMRNGLSPQQACEEVIERIFYVNKGKQNANFNVKMIAFNKDGEVGVAAITREGIYAPSASVLTNKGFRVIEGKVMR